MKIISKKKMNELLSLSNNPEIQLLEENKKSYKIMITGEKDKMGKSNFEQIVLEFIKEQREFNKEQREFNKNIETRLDNVEQDIKEIKSLPTIQKELVNRK